MENKLNSHRHFFLYAKGHYKQGDVLEDLGKICTNYLQHDLHNNRDRVRILIRATKTIKKQLSIEDVLALVLDESQQYNSPFDFGHHEIFGKDAVILATLQLLRHCTVDEIEGSLGTADYSILPKND